MRSLTASPPFSGSGQRKSISQSWPPPAPTKFRPLAESRHSLGKVFAFSSCFLFQEPHLLRRSVASLQIPKANPGATVIPSEATESSGFAGKDLISYFHQTFSYFLRL